MYVAFVFYSICLSPCGGYCHAVFVSNLALRPFQVGPVHIPHSVGACTVQLQLNILVSLVVLPRCIPPRHVVSLRMFNDAAAPPPFLQPAYGFGDHCHQTGSKQSPVFWSSHVPVSPAHGCCLTCCIKLDLTSIDSYRQDGSHHNSSSLFPPPPCNLQEVWHTMSEAKQQHVQRLEGWVSSS